MTDRGSATTVDLALILSVATGFSNGQLSVAHHFTDTVTTYASDTAGGGVVPPPSPTTGQIWPRGNIVH